MRKKKFPLESLPLLVISIVFIGLPILYIILLSFLKRSPSGGALFEFTLKNYTKILSPTYLKVFIYSLIIAVVTTIITLLLGYLFAYFVGRLDKKYRMYVIMPVLIPFWISSLLRLYGWVIMLRNDGIINSLLISFGIVVKPLTLLYNYFAMIVGTVYILLPLMIIPIYNSVEKIDESLIEASRDLGAGKFKTFTRVILPLTMPGIMGGITLVFIPAVGLFFVSDILGGGTILLIGNLISDQMGPAMDWPFGSALSVTMMIGVLISLYFYLRASKKTGGSIF